MKPCDVAVIGYLDFGFFDMETIAQKVLRAAEISLISSEVGTFMTAFLWLLMTGGL